MTKNNDVTKLPLSCKNLHAYAIDDSLLVYSDKTQNVYGFEKGSAGLFLGLDLLIGEEGMTMEDALTQYPDVNTDYLREMVELASCNESNEKVEYEADMDMGHYVRDDLTRIYYRVDEMVFAIHYPNKVLFDRLHPVFEHLHTQKQDAKITIAVDFTLYGELWQVLWNTKLLDFLVSEARLATFLQEKMMTSVYQAQPYLIALHAASVSKGDKVFIMPAVAESGKTTLTATLLRNGFNLFSDESTAMDSDGMLHPLPFCMNIKEGSWSILDPLYPILKNRDIHSRFDGKKIRFLPPASMSQKRKKANFLIFPKYIEGSPTILNPISTNMALSKIRDASYQVQGSMDRVKFEQIIENLLSLPKYTLVFSELDEVITTINRLIEE